MRGVLSSSKRKSRCGFVWIRAVVQDNLFVVSMPNMDRQVLLRRPYVKQPIAKNQNSADCVGGFISMCAFSVYKLTVVIVPSPKLPAK